MGGTSRKSSGVAVWLREHGPHFTLADGVSGVGLPLLALVYRSLYWVDPAYGQVVMNIRDKASTGGWGDLRPLSAGK